MDNGRTIGVILVSMGLTMVTLALGADLIGLGQVNAFGAKQVAGAIGGALVTVVGGVLVLQRQPT